MCKCRKRSVLTETSNTYQEFISGLVRLEVGNWVLLMQCPKCDQLYKVQEWDKYQNTYALKVASSEGWQDVDIESPIKERMIQNRGGLSAEACRWSGCKERQVKGSAFCVHHLYEGGTRA